MSWWSRRSGWFLLLTLYASCSASEGSVADAGVDVIEPMDTLREHQSWDAAAESIQSPVAFRTALGSDKQASLGHEVGAALGLLSDGDLLVGGSSENTPFSPQDAVIARVGGNGALKWAMAYGVDSSAGPTSDERIFAFGDADGAGAITAIGRIVGAIYTGLAFEIDNQGQILWARQYVLPNGGSVTCESGATASTGGAIFLGCTSGEGKDAIIVKVDRLGGLVWSRRLALAGEENVTQIIALRDGGCLAVGNSRSFAAGGVDGLAFRLDAEGQLRWVFSLSGLTDSVETVADAGEEADGTLVLVVYRLGMGNTPLDEPIVVKLSPDARSLWSKRFELPSGINGLSVVPGGIALVGSSFVAIADGNGTLSRVVTIMSGANRFQGYTRIGARPSGVLAMLGTSALPVTGPNANRFSTAGRLELLQTLPHLAGVCGQDIPFSTSHDGTVDLVQRAANLLDAAITAEPYPLAARSLEWITSEGCL
jgi:hypothetical protein